MPTIYIDRGDVRIEIQTTSVSNTVDFIRCRIVLDHQGLEVVLQDERFVYIAQGIYTLIAPEN